MKKLALQTNSASETIRIGKKIGGHLTAGDVVALSGELGAGKTQLIKGVAVGAGVQDSVYLTSPSFTLINEYPGRIPFYHIDLYRLEGEKEAEALGLEDYLEKKGIAVIEWADKIPSLLPEKLLWITMVYTGKNKRTLEIIGKGERYETLVEEIFKIGSLKISHGKI